MENITNLSQRRLVQVEAETWTRQYRRLCFCEAVLAQVLADKDKVAEWYTSAELVDLDLPNLPSVAAEFDSLAHAMGMPSRFATRDGRAVLEYHFLGLPSPAFEFFINRIVSHQPPPKEEYEDHFGTAESDFSPSALIVPDWHITVRRLLRSGIKADPTAILSLLIDTLPDTSELPTIEELKEAMP